MDNFGLIQRTVDNLAGPDGDAWNDRLNKFYIGTDPYKPRVARGKVFDVVRSNGIRPDNVLTKLANLKVNVSPKISAAVERELAGKHFSYLVDQIMRVEMPFVEFDPTQFGVNVDWRPRSGGWGKDGSVLYQDVVSIADKYHYMQPNFFCALYFRLSFLEAQKMHEGQHIYIGCRPVEYAEGKNKIIPGLSYSSHTGFALTAHEVGPNTLLNMSYSTGPGGGSNSSHTFVYGMP